MSNDIPTEEIDENQLDSQIELIKHIDDLILTHGIDLKNRSIILETEFESGIFKEFDSAMNILERNGIEPITIKMLSMGGSTYIATAMLGRIKASPCDVHIEAYGAIMSAACLILAGADYRKMSEYAYMMWHATSVELEFDNIEKQKDIIKQLDIEDSMWNKLMGKFTKKSDKFWSKLNKSRKDVYLDAKKCLEYGIIDEIF